MKFIDSVAIQHYTLPLSLFLKQVTFGASTITFQLSVVIQLRFLVVGFLRKNCFAIKKKIP